MRSVMTLLLAIFIPTVSLGSDFCVLGPRDDTITISSAEDDCPGTLFVDHDGTFESAFCWTYGGVQPPYYGAFAEGFSLGSGRVECASFWVTQTGGWEEDPLDLYIWEGGVSGPPGIVLYLDANMVLQQVPGWPTLGQNDFEVAFDIEGEFSIGYWADFHGGPCAWFLGADESNPEEGHPWTNIAPGVGYPTGWQHPYVVWGQMQAWGIGTYFTEGGTPAGSSTWGALKALFE